MLDIRAVAYIAPTSEVPFASVTLTTHLTNFADETGIVTGVFRVYNDNTGLLIHTSLIAPVSLGAGQSLDVTALTDFDPPAPADDTYFVMFDGNASNVLVPDGIAIHLGSFYFDVKPTGMGPAPAAHHATHEDGGSDEINVTSLSGLLADSQTPLEHGNEAHDPDFCPLPDPLDATLPLRADGQAARAIGIFCESEALQYSSLPPPPWTTGTIASGTHGNRVGDKLHPGIFGFTSSVSANSGAYIITRPDQILIAGSEHAHFVIRPITLPGTIIRLGFIDSYTIADETDGAYLEIAQVGGVDGVLVGKTAAASARSTTATSYTLVANTWYQMTVDINAAASLVTFTLYDEAHNQLWQDTLNSNIPTITNDETGHGLCAYNTGTTAVALVDIDYLSLWIQRDLTRE